VSVIAELIAEFGTVCAGLPDQRKTPPRDGVYAMADIGLSAFSLFFVGNRRTWHFNGRWLAAKPVEPPEPVRHGGHSLRQLHPPYTSPCNS
jgi:hypothetical protein